MIHKKYWALFFFFSLLFFSTRYGSFWYLHDFCWILHVIPSAVWARAHWKFLLFPRNHFVFLKQVYIHRIKYLRQWLNWPLNVWKISRERLWWILSKMKNALRRFPDAFSDVLVCMQTNTSGSCILKITFSDNFRRE